MLEHWQTDGLAEFFFPVDSRGSVQAINCANIKQVRVGLRVF